MVRSIFEVDLVDFENEHMDCLVIMNRAMNDVWILKQQKELQLTFSPEFTR